MLIVLGRARNTCSVVVVLVGATLSISFKLNDTAAPAAHQALELTVVYEIYDNVPLISKWVTVAHTSNKDGTDLARPVPASRGQPDDVIVNAIQVELFGANAKFGAYLTHGTKIQPTTVLFHLCFFLSHPYG